MSVGAKIPGELWMPPPRLSERALQSQVLDSVPLQLGTNRVKQRGLLAAMTRRHEHGAGW